MPLEKVINDPLQNVRLRPGDVVTVQHQPFSFVALGAVQRNAEVPFEGNGITLAEALGRAGGLNDRRADVKGVFVFRLEDRAALPALAGPDVQATADGRVPVVYTLRMTDAASLFAMQDFRMRDGDVLYISTAPGVELERFLQTISSTAFSIVATGNALNSQ
jgi:polysaccharide export outer membrane protein